MRLNGRPGQAVPSSLELNRGLSRGWQGLKNLSHHPLLPRNTSEKLDRKWNSQDVNWYPDVECRCHKQWLHSCATCLLLDVLNSMLCENECLPMKTGLLFMLKMAEIDRIFCFQDNVMTSTFQSCHFR